MNTINRADERREMGSDYRLGYRTAAYYSSCKANPMRWATDLLADYQAEHDYKPLDRGYYDAVLAIAYGEPLRAL